MLFKALKFAKLDNFDISSDEFIELLNKFKIHKPAPHDKEVRGWISPFGSESDELAIINDGSYQLCLQFLTRKVPKIEIDNAFSIREKEFFERNPDGVLKKAEIKEMREEIEYNLRPNFTPTPSELSIVIDTKNKLIYVNKNADKPWTHAMDLIKRMLGDKFKFTYFQVTSDVKDKMTSWIVDWDIPSGFSVGGGLKSKNAEKVTFETSNNDDIGDDKIVSFLNAGFTVQSLELYQNDRIAFTLNGNQSLSGIEFLDYFLTKKSNHISSNASDSDKESIKHEIMADHIVMHAAFAELIPKIIKALNED